MSGPWEKFQAADEGPWTKFQSSEVPSAPPLSRMEKIGRGVMDPIDGGAQLLANMLPEGVRNAGDRFNNWLADKTGLVARLPEGGVDQQVRDRNREYEARRAAAGEAGFDGYRTIGNIVSPANLALASRAPAAASLIGRMGVGAGAGAASAGLAPVSEGDFWNEKGKQVALGAGVGGAVPAIGAGIGRVISPNASRNPSLQLLRQEGVRPTIGQTLGGRLNALEEKAQSLPLVGDAISLARGRALDDFNKAAINRATGRVGTKVDKSGFEGVSEAGDAISQAYDNALGQIRGVQLDGQFNRELMQLRGMAQGLTTEMRGKFNRAINETLMRKVSRNGSILADDYKAIDSELGNLAASYGKSQVASEGELAGAVTQLRALLNQQMRRSNPQVADALSAADEAYANLVRVEGAAKAGANNSGLFTPGQLNTAIRTADGSVRKRAVSRGQALMQDLGNAGQSVLGNRVPNSGTWDRAVLGGGALGLGAVSPAIPLSLAAGAGLYTSPVQRLLGAAVASRPRLAQPSAELFRKTAPLLVPAGAQLGLRVLDQ